jgi:hypothetical protein
MAENARGRQSKVDTLIGEYGLDGLGDELKFLWTAENPNEHRSLRELADYFSRAILEAVLGETDLQPVKGEVENIYRLITADDVSAADRTRIRRRLEREGIDVDELRSDFVSYQAVRTYLREYKNAEYQPGETDRVKSTGETLQRFQSRTATVAEDKLEQLSEDDITLGDARVTVDIRVYCHGCDRQYGVGTLLDRGAVTVDRIGDFT